MFWIIIAAVILVISVAVAFYSMRGAQTWTDRENDDENLPPQPRGALGKGGKEERPSALRPLRLEEVQGSGVSFSPHKAQSEPEPPVGELKKEQKIPTAFETLQHLDKKKNADIEVINATIEQKNDSPTFPSVTPASASEIHTIDQALAVLKQHQQVNKQEMAREQGSNGGDGSKQANTQSFVKMPVEQKTQTKQSHDNYGEFIGEIAIKSKRVVR